MEQEKKVEKVISGSAKVKKKSEFQKFAGRFISDDADNVKTYVMNDIIIPNVKKTIFDVITNALDIVLNGKDSAIRGSRYRTNSRESYRQYYESPRDRSVSATRSVQRSGYSYDDIILETRGDAEEVLSKLDALIDTYGTASVSDLFEMVGITGPYTGYNYGWTDLHSATVERVRDGYLLKMPKALQLT